MAFAAVRNGDFIEIAGAEDKPEIELEQKLNLGVDSQDQSKSIDFTSASANTAYNVFSKRDNQFSVYSSNPGRIGGVSLETPKERLARLESEFREFKEDMEFIVAKEKSIQISDSDTNAVILGQIERVQQEIQSLVSNDNIRRIIENNIDSSVKSDFSLENALGILKKDLQNDLTGIILKRLQAMQPASSDNSGESQVHKSSKIEIFIDPKQEKLAGEAKYVEVEKRIANLEKALGTDKLKKQDFDPSGVSGSLPLVNRMESISQKLSLIDEKKSETILKRLADLESQIEKITTKRTALASANSIQPQDLKKIEFLHDKFQAVAGVAEELPSIVDRMEALKHLHEESAGLMNHIYSLTSLHEKIVSGISNNQSLLNSVNTNFASNLQKVLSNLSSIDSRIQALQK